MNYTIRTKTRPEVDIALDWAAAEGWNPGLYDANCFHATDPNGFLIGLLGEEAVATLSVVKYGGTFGFLGFYIVKPEYRGLGYASKFGMPVLIPLGIEPWVLTVWWINKTITGNPGLVWPIEMSDTRVSGVEMFRLTPISCPYPRFHSKTSLPMTNLFFPTNAIPS